MDCTVRRGSLKRALPDLSSGSSLSKLPSLNRGSSVISCARRAETKSLRENLDQSNGGTVLERSEVLFFNSLKNERDELLLDHQDSVELERLIAKETTYFIEALAEFFQQSYSAWYAQYYRVYETAHFLSRHADMLEIWRQISTFFDEQLSGIAQKFLTFPENNPKALLDYLFCQRENWNCRARLLTRTLSWIDGLYFSFRTEGGLCKVFSVAFDEAVLLPEECRNRIYSCCAKLKQTQQKNVAADVRAAYAYFCNVFGRQSEFIRLLSDKLRQASCEQAFAESSRRGFPFFECEHTESRVIDYAEWLTLWLQNEREYFAELYQDTASGENEMELIRASFVEYIDPFLECCMSVMLCDTDDSHFDAGKGSSNYFPFIHLFTGRYIDKNKLPLAYESAIDVILEQIANFDLAEPELAEVLARIWNRTKFFERVSVAKDQYLKLFYSQLVKHPQLGVKIAVLNMKYGPDGSDIILQNEGSEKLNQLFLPFYSSKNLLEFIQRVAVGDILKTIRCYGLSDDTLQTVQQRLRTNILFAQIPDLSRHMSDLYASERMNASRDFEFSNDSFEYALSLRAATWLFPEEEGLMSLTLPTEYTEMAQAATKLYYNMQKDENRISWHPLLSTVKLSLRFPQNKNKNTTVIIDANLIQATILEAATASSDLTISLKQVLIQLGSVPYEIVHVSLKDLIRKSAPIMYWCPAGDERRNSFKDEDTFILNTKLYERTNNCTAFKLRLSSVLL